jgi:hypothetical protein
MIIAVSGYRGRNGCVDPAIAGGIGVSGISMPHFNGWLAIVAAAH